MSTEKESKLFDDAFAGPFLYVCKSRFEHCLVHYLSKHPFQIKTLKSFENLDEIINYGIDYSMRTCIPFVKDVIYE